MGTNYGDGGESRDWLRCFSSAASNAQSNAKLCSKIGSISEPLSNTNYVDAAVTDGFSYVYEIAPSTDNNILGPFSNQVITQNMYPQPVTDFIASSGDNLVQLQWTYQGVATNSVFIQRKLGPAPNSAFQTIKSGLQGVNNYIDTGVIDKNFYVYHIYTVDSQGLTSINFASAVALPAKPPSLPPAPTGSIGAAVTLSQNSSNAQTLIGNTLSWGGADQTGIDATMMYPLGDIPYPGHRMAEGFIKILR